MKNTFEKAHAIARSKGWWDGVADPKATIPEKLALIHSEVSEALEDYRADKMDLFMAECGPEVAHDEDVILKPVGFPSELADIVIRVADLAGALDIDLEDGLQRHAPAPTWGQAVLRLDGASVLGAAGATAAAAQTLGYLRIAGAIMLAANLLVVILALANRLPRTPT